MSDEIVDEIVTPNDLLEFARGLAALRAPTYPRMGADGKPCPCRTWVEGEERWFRVCGYHQGFARSSGARP